MSHEVSHRLGELVEQASLRRRRMAEIRTEAAALSARAQRCSYPWARPAVRLEEAPGEAVPAREQPVAVLRQVRTLLSGDVLDQAHAVLQNLDTAVRDQWSTEDAVIVKCFREAWDAAGGKGYTAEDLQLILQALAPRVQ